jgi:hypothetical protein
MFVGEIATLIGSTIVGGILSLWGASIDSRKQKDMALLAVLDKKGQLMKEAREHENKGFQWTRRTIALTVVFSVVLLPKLASLFMDPSVDITLGYTQFNPGFLFVEGKDVVEWKTVKGVLITPLDTQLMASIAGLYFGGSLARSR